MHRQMKNKTRIADIFPLAYYRGMDGTDPFQQLLALARTGDAAALGELVRRYEPDVLTVARLRIGPALRPYLDSMDLVQSVHRSVMLGVRGGKFEFNGPQDLVALAVTIVRRKAARHWQKIKRQQRDSGGGEDTNLPDLLNGLSSPGDGPASNAAYQDAIKAVCSQLDPLEKQLLELHLQGYRTADIAEILNQNPDVLRVKLSRLRAKLRASGFTADWL
jgi:RNA polymerase sigma factor (sigma-70 family)